MTSNALIAKITQNPLLLQSGCEELFTQSILAMQEDTRFPEAMQANEDSMLSDDFWDDDDDFISWLRPYNVEDGVLTIPVHGVLLNKVSIKFATWITGYVYIEKAFERGMADANVHTIAFDIDSPGGEVAGNFALVEKIVAARDEKYIIAFANDHAYSAAYSIATAASEIVIGRSGGVGSIGVLMAHMDVSGLMEKRGIKVTFVYAGKHKIDGNPYEALPADVKARIQARIDRTYGEFVGLVAANRGMDETAVRATEALTYDAPDSLEVGLADRIGAMDEELAALRGAAPTENITMAIAPKTPTAGKGDQITQEQMDEAVASALADGMTAGATAERDRASAILDSDEAKERPVAARALADSGMDADMAKTALGKMPVESAETPAPAPVAAAPAAPAPAPAPATPVAVAPAPTPFASHMSGPEVGAQIEDPKAEGETTANDLLGSYAMLTGKDLRETPAN